MLTLYRSESSPPPPPPPPTQCTYRTLPDHIAHDGDKISQFSFMEIVIFDFSAKFRVLLPRTQYQKTKTNYDLKVIQDLKILRKVELISRMKGRLTNFPKLPSHHVPLFLAVFSKNTYSSALLKTGNVVVCWVAHARSQLHLP